MTHSAHAIIRALERYGLQINASDLMDLCLQCQQGYGRLSYLPDGKERHLLMCHGKPIVAVYAPYDGPYGRVPMKEGKIVTILPKEAASPGAKSSPASKPNAFRMRPKRKTPKKSRQRGYTI